MLTFGGPGGAFTYRVAAIVVRDGEVLLHRFEDEHFWCLPGGRVELGETAAEAITREMREELGVNVEVGPLLWIVENFFELHSRRQHEIGLYFSVGLPDDFRASQAQSFLGSEGSRVLFFRWFDRARLDALSLYPLFLRSALSHDLPAHATHVVNVDERAPTTPEQLG